jgi:hypothetical protein
VRTLTVTTRLTGPNDDSDRTGSGGLGRSPAAESVAEPVGVGPASTDGVCGRNGRGWAPDPGAHGLAGDRRAGAPAAVASVVRPAADDE